MEVGKTDGTGIPEIPKLTYIEYYMLLSLLSSPKHGLGVFEDVALQTNNQLLLSPGTLYAALKRMYASGWIVMRDPESIGFASDERRKIYELAPEGVLQLKAMLSWLKLEFHRTSSALLQREATEEGLT